MTGFIKIMTLTCNLWRRLLSLSWHMPIIFNQSTHWCFVESLLSGLMNWYVLPEHRYFHEPPDLATFCRHFLTYLIFLDWFHFGLQSYSNIVFGRIRAFKWEMSTTHSSLWLLYPIHTWASKLYFLQLWTDIFILDLAKSKHLVGAVVGGPNLWRFRWRPIKSLGDSASYLY